MPLKYVAEVNPATPEFDRLGGDESVTFLPLEAIWPGALLDTSRVRSKADVATGYTRFRAGDILVPKITPTFQANRSVIASSLIGGVGAGTTELHVVRPGPHADVRYLLYTLSSRPFLREGEGSMIGVAGQKRVPDEFLRDYPVLLPDPRRQRSIADYLDAETGRIDRMVQLLERLRTLLDDRWNHVLDDGVLGRTNGREPAQGTVPAGPFAGAVGRWPADWTPQPLKRVLVTNQSGVWGGDPTGNEDTVVLRSTDISISGAWAITDPATRSLSVPDAHTGRLRVGDLVVVTSSGSEQHIGKAALVDSAVADLGAAFSNFTQRLRTSMAADPRYVWYLLRSPFGKEQLRWLSSTTTGLRNLSGRVLGAVTFPGPPLSAQRRIVSALDEVRSDLDKIVGGLDSQIGLIVERRQALITAAVTGQLEIPGVAA